MFIPCSVVQMSDAIAVGVALPTETRTLDGLQGLRQLEKEAEVSQLLAESGATEVGKMHEA